MWACFITIIGLLQLVAIRRCEALDVTKYTKRCHYGESKCIIQSMNQVIKSYPKDIPVLGLKPIEIVDIKDFKIWKDVDIGAVWFKFRMYDQQNYGFENTTITEVRGFGRDPTSSLVEIHGEIPRLVHKGKYVVNGKILFIETNSMGESVSDFQNFKFFLKLKVLIEYRNNKRYLRVHQLVPRLKLDRWIIGLDDFYVENSDLTIAVNEVINKNWVEFWNELEPSILEVFQSVFTNLIEDVFQKVPYDDLFIEN
ncbi:circadian clock-controlled protein daywake-like isoform X1 [Drosophila elegans]|uniref:circadian clock-controlled protein daywake-like isoform X1 n=1 Tax=Drosophila elegans TaxID=30023 RepID=UPI0007E6271D|nr:circadian clock-controlled protein daywake-like isoform X1 [Drosophila elegans]